MRLTIFNFGEVLIPESATSIKYFNISYLVGEGWGRNGTTTLELLYLVEGVVLTKFDRNH